MPFHGSSFSLSGSEAVGSHCLEGLILSANETDTVEIDATKQTMSDLYILARKGTVNAGQEYGKSSKML